MLVLDVVAGDVPNTRVPPRWLAPLTIMLVAVSAAAVTLTATNRMTDSDAMGTLLASESLIQGHWLSLDHYPDLVKSVLGSRVEPIDGQLYYFFPIGTSLLVAPLVAVLGVLGVEMVPNDDKVQVALAAVAAVAIVLLSYGLARRFVGHWSSVLLAGVFWFGTSFASTGATALWSHDFGAVFSLVTLLLLVIALQRRARWWALWSGALAAMAWVIRPQLLILTLTVVVLLGLRWRRGVMAFIASWIVVGASFMVFSKVVTGAWLPAYYLPQRLEGGQFWEALAGTMVSPGRGLLVFTPMLMISLLLLGNWRSRSWDERSLVLLGITWLVLQWVAIARFPHWWGGWGFGPRLMMDALPGLLLVLAVLWPRTLRTIYARVTVGVFVVLAAGSVWIHTVQGLYNPYTRLWYVQPSIDESPEIVWDWSYPQFLASEWGHEERAVRRLEAGPPVQRGAAYSADAPELGLAGWSTGFWSPGISLDNFRLGTPYWWSEDERRWSEGSRVRIVFTLDPASVPEAGGRLVLEADSFGPQRYSVLINGETVASGVTVGVTREVTPTRISIPVAPGVLREGRNEMALVLPDAVTVGQVTEFRQIALALRQLSLQ